MEQTKYRNELLSTCFVGNVLKSKQDIPPQCTTSWSSVRLSHEYIEQWDFKIVKEVCITVRHGDVLSTDTFFNAIFGKYEPSNATVVFSHWMGLSGILHDTSCIHQDHLVYLVPPSSAVRQDADNYIVKYLNRSKYIALVVRMEKTMVHLLHRDPIIVEKCFDIIPDYMDRLKNTSGINTVFMSVDFGKFGSSTMKQYENKMTAKFTHFFRRLYGSSFTISQWEESFEETARYKSESYIALVQSWVAVKAEHLIMSGGGSFQNHVVQLFMNDKLRSSDKHTVGVVRECTGSRSSSALKAEIGGLETD